MWSRLTAERGFSLNELLLVVAIAGTMMAMALPVLNDVTETARLNRAAREIERELQSARLRAVSVNRTLRVRINCPAAGSFRTVEVIGGGSPIDAAANRCLQSAYPFPAPDDDLATRPNYDGPVRFLPPGTTVGNANLELRPDGTAFNVVSNTPQAISTNVTISVTRRGRSRTVTVNGAGRIQVQ